MGTWVGDDCLDPVCTFCRVQLQLARLDDKTLGCVILREAGCCFRVPLVSTSGHGGLSILGREAVPR